MKIQKSTKIDWDFMINSRPICQGDGVIALQFSGEKTNMEISILNV